MIPLYRAALGLVSLASAAALGAPEPDSTVKVNVVVGLPAPSRKIDRPTKGKPVYYLPLPAGYKEIGYAGFYQRPPPSNAAAEAMLEHQFATQGYLILTKGSHPSLVLELSWGYMSPTASGAGFGSRTNVPPDWIPTLLYGDTRDSIGFDGKRRDYPLDDLAQVISEHHGLYYVIISAFDFQDWLHHRVTLLWRERVSTPMWGHYFDEVFPAMAAAAAPLLGRETLRPELRTESLVPTGHVVIGNPVLKPASAPDIMAPPANP